MDVTNSMKAKMTISLNEKFQKLVTNVELSKATLLIVAQLKMSLAVHVRRKAITQKFANLPNEFKVLTPGVDDGSSEDDVFVMTIGETVNMFENNSKAKGET